ncbi:MAG: hypothetical protein OEU80_08375 [Deltaproteobacteria bacterium]|nr:hypothetical protein [Deltaproteobacteria bacterium]MDH3802085.1 hypothetical protein [Deltaproteobacteria bacterium]PNV84967.1 MAG: hypothetical protein C0610_14250 [Desulfobacteraceae bacterium]
MQLSRVFGLDETHSAKRKAHSAIWRDVRSGETSETAEKIETSGKGEKSDDRGRTAEGRKQLAAGRRQQAEIRDQKSEVRGQKQLVMYNV